jgi:hypothetical protein
MRQFVALVSSPCPSCVFLRDVRRSSKPGSPLGSRAFWYRLSDGMEVNTDATRRTPEILRAIERLSDADHAELDNRLGEAHAFHCA